MFDAMISWWFRGDGLAQAIGFHQPTGMLILAGFSLAMAAVGTAILLRREPVPELRPTRGEIRTVAIMVIAFALIGGAALWNAPREPIKRAALLRQAAQEPDMRVTADWDVYRIDARFQEVTFLGQNTGSDPIPGVSVEVGRQSARRIERALAAEGIGVAFRTSAGPEGP
jgi:hypothetical protein